METVPEKIFGYKILQESASQAKVPFEVGSFPVSLPGNLEMTANREKPEQLTFFFFEEMPKPTKGTIYLDTSKKGVTKFKTRRHNSYRAEVTYNRREIPQALRRASRLRTVPGSIGREVRKRLALTSSPEVRGFTASTVTKRPRSPQPNF